MGWGEGEEGRGAREEGVLYRSDSTLPSPELLSHSDGQQCGGILMFHYF